MTVRGDNSKRSDVKHLKVMLLYRDEHINICRVLSQLYQLDYHCKYLGKVSENDLSKRVGTLLLQPTQINQGNLKE